MTHPMSGYHTDPDNELVLVTGFYYSPTFKHYLINTVRDRDNQPVVYDPTELVPVSCD